ncbi:MAG: sensor histidine kinase [Cyclobacteriaceae bacterium]
MDHQLISALIFSSVALVFGLYNSLLFFELKQKIYLHYSVMILSVSAFNYTLHFWDHTNLILSHIVLMIGPIIIISMTLFSKSFIGITKYNYPNINITINWIVWLSLGLISLFIINMIGPQSIVYRNAIDDVVEYLNMFSILFLVISNIYLFTIETKARRFILLNFSLLIAAGLFAVNSIVISETLTSDLWVNSDLLYLLFTAQLILFSLFVSQKLKQLENEKLEIQRDINNKLEKEVLKKTRSLNNALDELHSERKSLADTLLLKNKLFSLVSHDLRNPLQNIKSLLQLSDQNLIDDKNREKISEAIKSKLSNSIDTINRLLTWSYHQLDGIKVQKEICTIEEYLEETKSELEQLMIDKSIKFLKHIEVPVVEIDPEMFRTILRNLISNAVKFSPKDSTILIKSFLNENKLEISITDQGPGMNANWYENMVLTGKPEIETGTEGEQGTGFGLMIVKDFVEMNDGKMICVSSRQGTTFRLLFPEPLVTSTD